MEEGRVVITSSKLRKQVQLQVEIIVQALHRPNVPRHGNHVLESKSHLSDFFYFFLDRAV